MVIIKMKQTASLQRVIRRRHETTSSSSSKLDLKRRWKPVFKQIQQWMTGILVDSGISCQRRASRNIYQITPTYGQESQNNWLLYKESHVQLYLLLTASFLLLHPHKYLCTHINTPVTPSFTCATWTNIKSQNQYPEQNQQKLRNHTRITNLHNIYKPLSSTRVTLHLPVRAE